MSSELFERLRYSPHLEYTKELILSEGIDTSLPAWMSDQLASPPSLTTSLLKQNREALEEMIEVLKQRLSTKEGFSSYESWIESGMPPDTEEDPQEIESGDLRADILLYRVLHHTLQATRETESMLRELGAEEREEQEREEIRRLVEQEGRRRELQKEMREVLPRLVDGITTDYDRRYHSARLELEQIEAEQQVVRRDLLRNLSPAFLPGARDVNSQIPKMRELVHGAIVNDIKGNPEPLINTILDILAEKSGAVQDISKSILALRQAMEAAANIQAIVSGEAVRIFSSTFRQPYRSLLRTLSSQMHQVQREIFAPVFGILDLLVDASPGRHHTKEIADFAETAVNLLESIDRGSQELLLEARRFDRSLTKGLRDSIEGIAILRQLEGYTKIFDDLLQLSPLKIVNPRERRQLVRTLVQSNHWDRFYHVASGTWQSVSDMKEESDARAQQ